MPTTLRRMHAQSQLRRHLGRPRGRTRAQGNFLSGTTFGTHYPEGRENSGDIQHSKARLGRSAEFRHLVRDPNLFIWQSFHWCCCCCSTQRAQPPDPHFIGAFIGWTRSNLRSNYDCTAPAARPPIQLLGPLERVHVLLKHLAAFSFHASLASNSTRSSPRASSRCGPVQPPAPMQASPACRYLQG